MCYIYFLFIIYLTFLYFIYSHFIQEYNLCVCQTEHDSRESSFNSLLCCYHYWLVARYQVLHFASQTLFTKRQRDRRRSNKDKKTDWVWERERHRERNHRLHRGHRPWSFSCTGPFCLSLPPSIHLSALHPLTSPLTPLALQGRPCLPSVVCPS